VHPGTVQRQPSRSNTRCSRHVDTHQVSIQWSNIASSAAPGPVFRRRVTEQRQARKSRPTSAGTFAPQNIGLSAAHALGTDLHTLGETGPGEVGKIGQRGRIEGAGGERVVHVVLQSPDRHLRHAVDQAGWKGSDPGATTSAWDQVMRASDLDLPLEALIRTPSGRAIRWWRTFRDYAGASRTT